MTVGWQQMQIAHAKTEVRGAVATARAEKQTIGLVPTMGALHDGHRALVDASVADCDFTVVSIFVNPTQFGPGEDLDKYPKTLDADAEICEQAGVDLIFAPEPSGMYDASSVTTVHVAGVTEGLCGAFRPGHFDGVTTVVCKLLDIATPDRAYFGEKDYQQLIVIRTMVADLDITAEIIGVPTVREADGLALSSRNRYLSREERAAAPALRQALIAGAQAAERGASGSEVEQIVADRLAQEPLFRVQYISAVHPDTLVPREGSGAPMTVLTAAKNRGMTRCSESCARQRSTERR